MMTTLDEIEARVKRETDLGATEWLGPSARAVDLADVDLLLRAVRQLAPGAYDHCFNCYKHHWDDDVFDIVKEIGEAEELINE
jgi:hypothetical protein